MSGLADFLSLQVIVAYALHDTVACRIADGCGAFDYLAVNLNVRQRQILGVGSLWNVVGMDNETARAACGLDIAHLLVHQGVEAASLVVAVGCLTRCHLIACALAVLPVSVERAVVGAYS